MEMPIQSETAQNGVMKWTGHSDYAAIKPYVDVADTIKAKEMDKLNGLVGL